MRAASGLSSLAGTQHPSARGRYVFTTEAHPLPLDVALLGRGGERRPRTRAEEAEEELSDAVAEFGTEEVAEVEEVEEELEAGDEPDEEADAAERSLPAQPLVGLCALPPLKVRRRPRSPRLPLRARTHRGR